MVQYHNLEVKNVSGYRQSKLVFSSVSFRLNSGSLIWVRGPNGVGKSTLLRVVSGLAKPDSGDVLWKNCSIYKNRIAYNDDLHYLGHADGLHLGLTIKENLFLISKLSRRPLPACFDYYLNNLHLYPYKNTLVKHLSAGQRRRTSLLKLFLFHKRIWLLDEPLTSLDDRTQQFFLDELSRHLNDDGMSVICSHHTLHGFSGETIRLAPCST
jgi:heme exporter protein A